MVQCRTGYYWKNRKLILQRSFLYRQTEQFHDRYTIYRLETKESRNAYSRQWYYQNREKEIARVAAWVKANPEKVKKQKKMYDTVSVKFANLYFLVRYYSKKSLEQLEKSCLE